MNKIQDSNSIRSLCYLPINATFSPWVIQAPFSVFVGRLTSKNQPFHENVGICIHKNVSFHVRLNPGGG